MGRGLSQQQRDILMIMRWHEDRVVEHWANNEKAVRLFPREELRELDSLGLRYGTILMSLLEDDGDVELCHQRKGWRDTPLWGGLSGESDDRSLFTSSPEVRCAQASLRRAIKRLADRDLITIVKAGLAQLTLKGYELSRMRLDNP
jgi:hypothetical protein